MPPVAPAVQVAQSLAQNAHVPGRLANTQRKRRKWRKRRKRRKSRHFSDDGDSGGDGAYGNNIDYAVNVSGDGRKIGKRNLETNSQDYSETKFRRDKRFRV